MTATARVALEIQMTANSAWGDDCTVAQIKKQAEDCVRREVHKVLSQSKYSITIRRCITIELITTIRDDV